MADRWDEKAIIIANDVLSDGIAKLGAKHIAAALREAFEAGKAEERNQPIVARAVFAAVTEERAACLSLANPERWRGQLASVNDVLSIVVLSIVSDEIRARGSK